MVYEPVRCPACGAENRIDDRLERFWCISCGELALADAARAYTAGIGSATSDASDRPLPMANLEDDAARHNMVVRAFMLLEDSEWARAGAFFDAVLDYDPQNAEAHLGKLLGKHHLHKMSSLAKAKFDYRNDPDYKRALEYADDDFKSLLIRTRKTWHDNAEKRAQKQREEEEEAQIRAQEKAAKEREERRAKQQEEEERIERSRKAVDRLFLTAFALAIFLPIVVFSCSSSFGNSSNSMANASAVSRVTASNASTDLRNCAGWYVAHGKTRDELSIKLAGDEGGGTFVLCIDGTSYSGAWSVNATTYNIVLHYGDEQIRGTISGKVCSLQVGGGLVRFYKE